MEQGLGIPQDLAVVGAGKLALRLIESKSVPKLQAILLKPRLVVRESSAKRLI